MILTLVVIACVVAFVLWALNRYLVPPFNPTIKMIILAVVLILGCWLMLSKVGVLPGLF
jgi:hypothetical protein